MPAYKDDELAAQFQIGAAVTLEVALLDDRRALELAMARSELLEKIGNDFDLAVLQMKNDIANNNGRMREYAEKLGILQHINLTLAESGLVVPLSEMKESPPARLTTSTPGQPKHFPEVPPPPHQVYGPREGDHLHVWRANGEYFATRWPQWFMKCNCGAWALLDTLGWDDPGMKPVYADRVHDIRPGIPN